VDRNNKGMTLDEFKRIYWMEHAHRVYGRFLGLAVILPSLFFTLRKGWMSPRNRRLCWAISALVCFQVFPHFYAIHQKESRVDWVGGW